jgi:hypothetical protein
VKSSVILQGASLITKLSDKLFTGGIMTVVPFMRGFHMAFPGISPSKKIPWFYQFLHLIQVDADLLYQTAIYCHLQFIL